MRKYWLTGEMVEMLNARTAYYDQITIIIESWEKIKEVVIEMGNAVGIAMQEVMANIEAFKDSVPPEEWERLLKLTEEEE